MREAAGSAAAPAARCRNCLRWGSFMLSLPESGVTTARPHPVTCTARRRIASWSCRVTDGRGTHSHRRAAEKIPASILTTILDGNIPFFALLTEGRLPETFG